MPPRRGRESRAREGAPLGGGFVSPLATPTPRGSGGGGSDDDGDRNDRWIVEADGQADADDEARDSTRAV